jgi:hypothetical protein
MSTESPRRNEPTVYIPLSFDLAMEASLKVDPKKLPQKGRPVAKAVKKKGSKDRQMAGAVSRGAKQERWDELLLVSIPPRLHRPNSNYCHIFCNGKHFHCYLRQTLGCAPRFHECRPVQYLLNHIQNTAFGLLGARHVRVTNESLSTRSSLDGFGVTIRPTCVPISW